MADADPIRMALEAAAVAIEETMFAEHELPLDEELHRKYLQTTSAGIAAFLRALPEERRGIISVLELQALADMVEARRDA